MRLFCLLIAIVTLLVAALPQEASAQCTSRSSMSGEWNATDGAKYTVRQNGNDVWWVGISGDGGKSFINVFRGTRSGQEVRGDWFDIRGSGAGTLVLRIEGPGDNRVFAFTKAGGTGSGFGARRWSFPCPG